VPRLNSHSYASSTGESSTAKNCQRRLTFSTVGEIGLPSILVKLIIVTPKVGILTKERPCLRQSSYPNSDRALHSAVFQRKSNFSKNSNSTSQL